MFSEKTIALVKQVVDTYKEFGKSVSEDTNNLADSLLVAPVQIFFKAPADADEQLIRSYLPEVINEHESGEFKHLEFYIGTVRCVTLVKKVKED